MNQRKRFNRIGKVNVTVAGATFGIASSVALFLVTAAVIAAITVPLTVLASQSRVIHLKQIDFDSGTYRIKAPYTSYILDEDINFEPIPSAEASRADKPDSGWFAAISVEANHIVIDLNGKTLQATQSFLDNHFFTVYADIELDNSPFGGPLFGLIGASYVGDAFFQTSNFVEIKNGHLARASHWNIHGNNNANVSIHDVTLGDFEVSAIEMNGVVNCTYENIYIYGIKHPIRVTPTKIITLTLAQYLKQLSDANFPGAADQYTELTTYVNSHPEIYNITLDNPTNNVYGIFITSGFPSLVPFPESPDVCALGAFFSGGQFVTNIVIRNVLIENITAAAIPTTIISSNGAFGLGFQLSLIGLPVAGTGLWGDAYNSSGGFDPNPVLRSQIFAVNSQIALHPEFTGSLAVDYPFIADAIMTGNHSEFLAHALPLLGQGLGVEGLGVHGSFGVRLDCASNSIVQNVTVRNLKNVGDVAKDLSEIPDGNMFDPSQLEFRYTGNDAWGFEFASNTGNIYKYLYAYNISSLHGNVFGLDMASTSTQELIDSCISTLVYSNNDNYTSLVNPPSVSYGFRAQLNIGPITFFNNTATIVTAPRHAFGFAAQFTTNITYNLTESENVVGISSDALNSTSEPVESFGYYVEEGNFTLFQCVVAQNITLSGVNTTYYAGGETAVVAGIELESGFFNTIENYTITQVTAGASGGTAANIPDTANFTTFVSQTCG